MSDPHATPPTASDKSTKALRKAGASPAAEGSAPSAVLTSSNGATEPMPPREVTPPEEIAKPAEERPRALVDDREPPSDPAPRRFNRGSRIDEDEIPEEALDALVRGLAKRGYVLAKSEPTQVLNDEEVRVIPDANVAALAGALTDAQVQELLAIRANGVDLQKWRARGAIPGMHWIPTARARCTIAGVPGQELVPNQPVLMSDLDEATTKQFLANGTIHAPGQEPRNPHKRA